MKRMVFAALAAAALGVSGGCHHARTGCHGGCETGGGLLSSCKWLGASHHCQQCGGEHEGPCYAGYGPGHGPHAAGHPGMQGCNTCGQQHGWLEGCAAGNANRAGLLSLAQQHHAASAAQEMAPAPPPSAGAVAYPYYTTRGPRDFLLQYPRPIGP